MDVAAFKEAQTAYARGDYRAALEGFTVCARDMGDLPLSDLSKFYHLIGNCYVKNGDPRAAAAFYSKALAGSPEKRKPSLYVNLGTALLGTGDYEGALDAFTRALDYPVYATPYKAYSGIGAAQLKLGDMTEAGAAYREAALDPGNPAPDKALVNLGVCFMELGRTDDAITSYETALEFDMDDHAAAKTYANLGQAYMSQGRIPKAIDAFERAAADGSAELSPMAQHDYELALTLNERLGSKVPGILDTGFIPTVAMLDGDSDVDEPAVSEMTPSESGHLPVFGEEGFDPFAPQTQALDAVGDAPQPADASGGEVDDAELAAALEQLGLGDDSGEMDLQPDDDVFTQGTEIMSPVGATSDLASGAERTQSLDALGDYEEVTDEFGILAASEAGGTGAFDTGDLHMPSPEDTEFFDITEQQIAEDARAGRRKARRARSIGLKIAIFIVVICIVLAGAACVGYVLGYGYPLQEDVASDFFAAAQAGEDTSQYWASDVDAASQEAQTAMLSGLTSYNVEAVQRDMSTTIVYVKGTLEEGGQIDYEVVMSRDNISWAVEYVELYFASHQ